MKNFLKNKNIALIGGILLCLGATAAFAAPPVVTLGTISKSVDSTVSNLATVIIDIAVIAGICFIIAAFFKLHMWKQNPQQVQMSQGISLLLIGAGLTLIPLLIPTASVSVLGTQGKNVAQIGGKSIHDLIGGSGL
jgi:intracellular multiplication protein IcmD